MDLYSSGKWLSDHQMEMMADDSAHAFMNQLHLQQINSHPGNSVDSSGSSFPFKSFPSNNKISNLQSSTSTLKSEPQVSEICFEKPIALRVQQQQQKPWKPSCPSEKASSSSSTINICFVNSSDSPRASANNYHENSNFYVKPEIEASVSLENVNLSALENQYGTLLVSAGEGGIKRGATRTPAQAQDHVLAERKRRERMTQKFVALSTVIPGLKKLDKATVLGDAINYIKELQERVKKLEEEVKRNNNNNNNNNNEETVLVGMKRPRPQPCGYDDSAASSSSDGNFDSSCSDMISVLPEVEVRASQGNLLLRVYCKQQTGIIKDILGEMERHHLTMVSSSIIPFGDNRLHLTIIAQMADHHESDITEKDVVDNLRKAIQALI